MDAERRSDDRADDADGRSSEHRHHLHPEPLHIDLEDVIDALPHGDNPHPPSESEVQAPG